MLTRDGTYRKRLVRWESGVRFLTFSCHGRLPLLGNAKIRDVFVESLLRMREEFDVTLYAWVVMPEHVHLLIRPDKSADRPLLWLKMSVAQRVLNRWRELDSPLLSKLQVNGSPRFWLKGGGFDRNVRAEGEFSETVNYIHRNPVTRGLVERPEDWTWSSVQWWMGKDTVECDPPPPGVVQRGSKRAWIELKKALPPTDEPSEC
ncbi:MAG: transposase [Phycisphaerales bacterium]